MNNRYDAIVVGTGPAGGSVAKNLADAGAKVLILEKGREMKPPQSSFSALPALSVKFLEDKNALIHGSGTGGSSLLYFSTAAEPHEGFFEKYGIDLKDHIEAVKKELPYGKLEDRLVGKRSQQIMQAAQELGYDWQLLPKLMHQKNMQPGDHPFAGRWSSSEYITRARAKGAELIAQAEVLKVLFEGDKATGVEYRHRGATHKAFAKKIILSAGGTGTPAIMRRSGLDNAGNGFFCDPLVFIMGSVPGLSAKAEIPMTAGMNLKEEGMVLTDIYLPIEAYAAFTAMSFRLDQLFTLKSNLTIMVKIKDAIEGEITADEKLLRSLTPEELKVLDRGSEISKEILYQAGAKKIFETRISAAHPGGSVRIGDSVDSNLETSKKNLFVCDTSVIPEPWGLPPTLSMVALGKRLAQYLSSGQTAKAQKKPEVTHA